MQTFFVFQTCLYKRLLSAILLFFIQLMKLALHIPMKLGLISNVKRYMFSNVMSLVLFHNMFIVCFRSYVMCVYLIQIVLHNKLRWIISNGPPPKHKSNCGHKCVLPLCRRSNWWAPHWKICFNGNNNDILLTINMHTNWLIKSRVLFLY